MGMDWNGIYKVRVEMEPKENFRFDLIAISYSVSDIQGQGG